MQKSKFAERNVSTQNVSTNLVEYNWPYSQPRLVNTVRATSRMGILMGIISAILLLNDSYIGKGYLITDTFLTLGFIILRLFIIPAIRRGQIKYVASESRNLNKFIMMASCIFMYAGIVRFVSANVFFVINQGFNFDRYISKVFPVINTTALVIGIIGMLLPIIFLVFPKDISIREYHHKMRNIWNEYSIMNKPVEPTPVIYETPTIQRAPNNAPGTYVNHHRTSRPEVPKPNVATQTATTQQTNKNHKNQNKKSNHLTPQQKPSVSVWDSEKSVRRPRK